MSPTTHPMIRLSDAAKAALGRTGTKPQSVFDRLDVKGKYLIALNAKSDRTGAPVFAGVGLAEKSKRRAKGRVAKASRKQNRSR